MLREEVIDLALRQKVARAARIITDRFIKARARDPRMASFLAARQSGCIAYSVDARGCLCAPCLNDCLPGSDEELDLLGVLVVATSRVPEAERYCCSCGADLSAVIR
jgi:hypothetical protein